MAIMQSRRRFLSNLALAGSTGLGGAGVAGILGGGALGVEPPPENTEIRLKKVPIYCEGPQYIAEELLRAEGVTIRDVAIGPTVLQSAALAHGEFDFGLLFAPELVMALEAGLPITVLAGVHNGCFELFGNERIRGIADLKDRTVGALSASTATQLVTIMASYIGLDPAKDLRWIIDPTVAPVELFTAGRIDAFLAVPPESLARISHTMP
jgi:NitT/TauT family transport system substrate-binding protein